jgi:glycosyltransferase involved in cell wall biosynthesis
VRILLINKFYYLSGGAERYLFEWEKLLHARGHRTLVFSMQHPLNRPSEQARFFTPEVRFDVKAGLWDKGRAALRSLWNREARDRMRALLDAEGAPDVAHLHSYIYQLTPAVLDPLLERGVPVIQTCHDYARVCVNQHLYNHRTNTLCEACLRQGRLSSLTAGCIKGSYAASAAGCAAGMMDDLWARSRRRVRRFITPSAFMREKMIEGGMPPGRVFHVPHYIDTTPVRPSDAPGDYLLFLGRLVPQKGILTFLRAAQRMPDAPCKVVGTGAMEEQVRAFVREKSLANVAALGYREGEELDALVRGARAVVVPSEWHEPFSLVILEAMAAGRAVVASRVAGPAEIVSHGEDGVLVTPGDIEQLAAALRRLWNDPERARAMGRKGLEKARTLYHPDLHYRRMMRHFEEVRQ